MKRHRIGEKYGMKACMDCGLINEELLDEECNSLNIPLAKRIDIIERELLVRYLMKKLRHIEEKLEHCVMIKSAGQRRNDVNELYREVIKINEEYKDKEILPLANFRKGIMGVEYERIGKKQDIVKELQENVEEIPDGKNESGGA